MPLYAPLLFRATNVALTTADTTVVLIETQSLSRALVQLHNVSTTARTVKTTVYARLTATSPWALFTADNGGVQPSNIVQNATTLATFAVHGVYEIRIDCRVLTGTGAVNIVIRGASQ